MTPTQTLAEVLAENTKLHGLYREAQRNADNAEIEAAYWRTTAILAQGRLTRLTQDDHREK